MAASTVLSTDVVAPRERAPHWREWVLQHFGGLESDLYGDTEFDGHIAASRAGDVILTRLEANRHRVLRSAARWRAPARPAYLKIVAPWQGSAAVAAAGPRGLRARRRLGDLRHHRRATRSHNPERVRPPDRDGAQGRSWPSRGLPLDGLMARRVGGASGISRVALETMRNTYQELPQHERGGGARRRRADHAAGAAVAAGAGRPGNRHDAARSPARTASASHVQRCTCAIRSCPSTASPGR